ncbi:MAG: glycoside hydrolase family 78, partial [Acidobacteriota bacterium]
MKVRRRWLAALAAVALGLLMAAPGWPSVGPRVPSAAAADGPWTGRWVWSPKAGPRNTWLALRLDVDLGEIPESVPARIAVDSKYWLWVNGELVVFEGGLKRGPTPDGTYYDRVDLAPHLRPGPNTLAVLAWYWGRQGLSHRSSGRGGVLVDARAAGVDLSTGSGAWRYRVHPAYGRDEGRPRPNFRLPERDVRYDARRDPGPWTAPEYPVDGRWGVPTVKGQPGDPPWGQLQPRPVPLWRFSEIRPYGRMTIEDLGGGARRIVGHLPHAAQVTPWLEVAGDAGLEVDIRTDAYWSGGDTSVRAEYVTRAGRQSFEALGWMAGQRVEYTVPAGVEVLAVGYRESGYPADLAGAFRSGDPFLDALWRKGARTLAVNLRDSPMDCPDRERAQWWGDLVIGLDMAAYALDPVTLASWRKGMAELVAWRRDDGVLYSPVPEGKWKRELPQQMLAAVGHYGFWTYYLHTGDREALEAAYPAVRDYLALWRWGDGGRVVPRRGDWDWSDWGEEVDAEILENAWYALGLRGASSMATVLGLRGEAAAYDRRLGELRTGFEAFWTGAAYRSPGHRGRPDDRAHALAVLAGLVPRARWDAVAEVLATE